MSKCKKCTYTVDIEGQDLCEYCAMEDLQDPFGGLDDDLDTAKTTSKPAVKHPCGQCGGSGKWRGGTNQHGQKECFACKGTGHFKTSQADRDKAKVQRKLSKAKRLVNAQEAFEEQYPGLISELVAISSWNQFASSMVLAFNQYGALTEKQVAASQSMLVKIAEKKAARDAEKQANETTVNLAPIWDMFESAMDNGLKRPKYRAESLVISMAPSHGVNAGHLYVKTEGGTYQGKITPDNVFKPAYEVSFTTLEALKAIAANPKEMAVKYGRITSSCSCCGRELTDPNSIAAGIGPICANKWNL